MLRLLFVDADDAQGLVVGNSAHDIAQHVGNQLRVLVEQAGEVRVFPVAADAVAGGDHHPGVLEAGPEQGWCLVFTAKDTLFISSLANTWACISPTPRNSMERRARLISPAIATAPRLPCRCWSTAAMAVAGQSLWARWAASPEVVSWAISP